MSLNGKDAIFRWQSRGSADNNSCDVLFKDLVLNEPGDYTWHTYSYRVTCKDSMTTDYGWFFFNYYNFEPKQAFPDNNVRYIPASFFPLETPYTRFPNLPPDEEKE